MSVYKEIRYFIYSLIVVVTILGSGFSDRGVLFSAEDKSVVIDQKVDFYLDYATFFKGTLGKSFVEIYIAVPMKSLTYSDDLNGSFSVSVQIFDKDNKVVAEDYWGQKVKIKNKEEKYSTSEFPAITKFSIKPGTYRMLVEVKDLTSGASAEIDISHSSEKFVVKDYYERIYEDKKVTISSVQLCSKILKITGTTAKEKSDFSKNGYNVLPNPRKLYGTFRPFMDYMVEIYGIEKGKKYFVKWQVNDSEGNIVLKSDYKEKEAPGSTMALTGRVKIHTLKTGSYYLKLFVSDNKEAIDEEDVLTETMNNFFIFRKIDFTKNKSNNEVQRSINTGVDDIENYDFTITLNNKQIEREYNIVNATLLPASEKDLAAKLNIDGKRNFLNQFWIKQEKIKKDSRKIFLSAVNHVNRKYSTGNKKGWETDRGRVFLMAGKPDTQEAVLSNQNKLDHEIWRYFKDNYIFVFIDKHGLSDFRILHSNYKGEKYDPNWEEKLEKKMIGF